MHKHNQRHEDGYTNTDIKNYIKQAAASGNMIVLQEYLGQSPFRPPIFFFLINYLNLEELNAVMFFLINIIIPSDNKKNEIQKGFH